MNTLSHQSYTSGNPSPLESLLLRSSSKFLVSFFSTWTPDLILKLRLLNLRMHLFVTYIMGVIWNIDTFFENWFHHPEIFRYTLAVCDAFVSGSQALQFFETVRYPTSDLDIFVPLSGFASMNNFLLHEGYTFVSKEPRRNGLTKFVHTMKARQKHGRLRDLNNPNILGIADFVCTEAAGHDAGRKVQVIVSRGESLNCILGFHSSKLTL